MYSRRTIRFGCAIEKKVDLTQFFAKLNAKKPMEYYSDGKISLVKKDWADAKRQFLAYQCYADARRQKTLPPELEKLEMRDPYEDQHLEYLEYLQRKLDEETPEDPELALLWSKKAYSNPYTQARQEWRSIYPLRKEAPKPIPPQNPLSPTVTSPTSSTSTTESTFTGTK